MSSEAQRIGSRRPLPTRGITRQNGFRVQRAGRWDIPRQLAKRPGIPLPVEIESDDFTEDIDENRILLTALRVLARREGMADVLGSAFAAVQILFADVESLPRGMPLPDVRPNRLNQYYTVPLRWHA